MSISLTICREGDIGRMSWSPFWTLRRLIGESLFNYVGPDTSHHRNVFIREFNSTKSNAEKLARSRELLKSMPIC